MYCTWAAIPVSSLSGHSPDFPLHLKGVTCWWICHFEVEDPQHFGNLDIGSIFGGVQIKPRLLLIPWYAGLVNTRAMYLDAGHIQCCAATNTKPF
jgi:hypothetical protein